ncbi:Exostosin family protein isoform 1 [Hibiscus syriacus]|uniref:Exostosin family protein isoform 1 n=1 Tax=Hibiscus syriacus TaxID=106335 RepID=A0A6A3A3M8_HIBSY|nr:Exostosin family protein isoform 1 [Hibiscus syriacus]
MGTTKLAQNPRQAIRIVEDITKNNSNLNQPSWSYILRNHLSQGTPDQVLYLHTQIRQQGLYSLGLVPLIFKACASASAQTYGKSLHAEVFDEMPERNVVIWNAMIGGYLKNGDRESALYLFEKMPIGRNSVTWIEMIDGFAKSGDTLRATRQFFDKVPLELRNVVTWTAMVDGCNANGQLEAAREIFEMMPERNYFVWSSMISGFCKRGDVKEARIFFDRIPVRNLVNWNSMISGYAQNGFCEEALELFRRMQNEGFEPDEVTSQVFYLLVHS